MNRSYIFLTDGFEEIEAVATLDVLRRAGIDVVTVSLTGSLAVTGGHGAVVTADRLFEQGGLGDAHVLILPGGTVRIDEHDGLKDLLRAHHAANGMIGAICAAPMVLGGLGMLSGRHATCYPGFEKYLGGAIFTPENVVVNGNIITGRGPGAAVEFALKIVSLVCGNAISDQVRADMFPV